MERCLFCGRGRGEHCGGSELWCDYSQAPGDKPERYTPRSASPSPDDDKLTEAWMAMLLRGWAGEG